MSSLSAWMDFNSCWILLIVRVWSFLSDSLWISPITATTLNESQCNVSRLKIWKTLFLLSALNVTGDRTRHIYCSLGSEMTPLIHVTEDAIAQCSSWVSMCVSLLLVIVVVSQPARDAYRWWRRNHFVLIFKCKTDTLGFCVFHSSSELPCDDVWLETSNFQAFLQATPWSREDCFTYLNDMHT